MANAIHPEDAGKEDYAVQLAAQELYYECYMASFSREKLIEFLQVSRGGEVKVPENVDPEKYVRAYVSKAESILKMIQDGKL